MTAGYDETLAYLETRYLTLEQLAAASRLEARRLDELIAAGLLPAHSHEAVFSLTVEALINGRHEVAPRRVRYFHPDLATLAAAADAQVNAVGLNEAQRTTRARHDQAVAEASGLAEGTEAHKGLSDQAWSAWCDGTYGVCLQRVSTANMIRKVFATRRMEVALADRAGVDRQDLADALDRYAAVSGPFGPHERAGSTRARVYEPALALLETLDPTPTP